MSDTPDKGAFQADIPSSAVEEALRSVEKIARGGAAAATAVAEPGAEVPVEADAAPADPRDPERASLEAQLELSQAKGRELMDKLKEEHERLLRSAADLDNTRKRHQREKDELQKFAVEKLAKDLLPVVDNLDRALAAAPAADPLVDGVKLVRTSLEQVLARVGVRGFSAMGQPFDPARHEALLQVPSADQPPGTVVLEHARGFTLHDRLPRPAMVGVAVAPPAADAAAPGDPPPGAAGGEGGPSNEGT